MLHIHMHSYLVRGHTSIFFCSSNTATTDIYTLSLHDALPISRIWQWCAPRWNRFSGDWAVSSGCLTDIGQSPEKRLDRKSTRLNSSHTVISYAVFCLKKKKQRAVLLVVDCLSLPLLVSGCGQC